MGWNNPLIPGCKIDSDSNTIVCDAKKILGEKVIQGEGPIRFTVENGQFYTIDDGGNPEEMVKQVQIYIKKTLRAKKM